MIVCGDFVQKFLLSALTRELSSTTASPSAFSGSLTRRLATLEIVHKALTRAREWPRRHYQKKTDEGVKPKKAAKADKDAKSVLQSMNIELLKSFILATGEKPADSPICAQILGTLSELLRSPAPLSLTGNESAKDWSVIVVNWLTRVIASASDADIQKKA